ncbi:MAG: hypothetical protein IJI49_00210 [Bacilli bacterium]|nr:hypothetical protein [Bacilli bacterium]
MKVSKKYIVNIWEFMSNYYGIIYDGNYKLTHNEMCYYLKNKDIYVKRLSFNSINDASILCGDVVLVRDEEGKIIPYVSPVSILDLDLEDINSSCGYLNIKPNYIDVSDIGKKDYENYSYMKSKILPRKKRVRRRGYE